MSCLKCMITKLNSHAIKGFKEEIRYKIAGDQELWNDEVRSKWCSPAKYFSKIRAIRRYPLWYEDSRFVEKRSLITITPFGKVSRTRCYFDIALLEDKQFLGRLVFELYNDYAPKTCANFAGLCEGRKGFSYRGTPFHRIVPNYWCQGGDVTKFNGIGGTSIYGDTFEDENFELKHACVGALSMWSNGPDSNNSKFNLTFRRLETMDGRRVVFGKVISGLKHLRNIEYFGTKTGKPLKTLIVANCGVFEAKNNEGI